MVACNKSFEVFYFEMVPFITFPIIKTYQSNQFNFQHRYYFSFPVKMYSGISTEYR